MTYLTLHPHKVIDVIKETLGPPTLGVSFCLNPVVASRPRVPRFGKPYYAKTYATWRTQAFETIKKSDTTINDYCVVLVEQIKQKPKTTKKLFPYGDVDNYAKAPLDILTKKEFWEDDDLVAGLYVSKRFASEDEEPRTEVSIYVHKEPS